MNTMQPGSLVEVRFGHDERPDWAKGGDYFFGVGIPFARLIKLADPATIEVLRTGQRDTVPLNQLRPADTRA